MIRYRTAMIRLNEALESLESAWAALDYESLVDAYPRDNKGAGYTYVRSIRWRARDVAATKELLGVVEHWRDRNWPA